MRNEKTSGLGLFRKLKEHVVFMKEAAKNCAFLGSFFHYFLWGGREGGGGMTVIHQNRFSDFLRIVVMCRVKPMATGFTGIGAHVREKNKKKGVTKNGMPTPVAVLFSEPPSQQLSEIMLCNYPSHKLEKSDQVFTKRKNCRIQVEYLQQLWVGPHLEVRHS
jgi:methionine-rich copper-binding protein CopC